MAALQLDSLEWTFYYRGLTEPMRGRGTAAAADLERTRLPASLIPPLGAAYALADRTDEARQMIRNREARGELSPTIWMALGDVDRGLDEYARQFRQVPRHPRCLEWWYQDYEDDPRVQAIVERVFP